MIPILHRGELVQCGPGEDLAKRHCPTCDGFEGVRVVWAGSPEVVPIARVVDCPGCGSTAPLEWLLDRSGQ